MAWGRPEFRRTESKCQMFYRHTHPLCVPSSCVGPRERSRLRDLDFTADDHELDVEIEVLVGIDLLVGVASYSVRSAAIGLIRVARRAGNQVATKAAAVRRTGAIVKASGSSAPTL